MSFARSIKTIGEFLLWLAVTNGALFLIGIALLLIVHVSHVHHV